MGRGLGIAVLAGSMVMLILGWLPIIGPLLTGLAAGALAKSAGRGALAGFWPEYWVAPY